MNNKQARRKQIVPIYSQHRNISIDRRWNKDHEMKETVYVSDTVRVTEYVNQVPAKERLSKLDKTKLTPEQTNTIKLLNKIGRINNSICEVIMATGCSRLHGGHPIVRVNAITC